jgi:hypothetical protein
MPKIKDDAQRKGHVAVRLDNATIARLDALLPLYALPGREATRSDALRAVILAGIDVEERRAPRPDGTPPPGAGGVHGAP